jgi:hypothetical protein
MDEASHDIILIGETGCLGILGTAQTGYEEIVVMDDGSNRLILTRLRYSLLLFNSDIPF